MQIPFGNDNKRERGFLWGMTTKDANTFGDDNKALGQVGAFCVGGYFFVHLQGERQSCAPGLAGYTRLPASSDRVEEVFQFQAEGFGFFDCGFYKGQPSGAVRSGVLREERALARCSGDFDGEK